MKLPRFSTLQTGNDTQDAPVGGTAFAAVNTGFVAEAYKKAKGGLVAYRHGREVGLKSPSEATILENPAQPFIEIIEATYDAHVGHAESEKMHALAEIDLGLEDLNESAIKASIENKIAADRYAAEEQAKPAIERRNDAWSTLKAFEFCEGQDPLAEDAYDPWGSAFKQLLRLLFVLVPDAFFNAFTFASAMPQGLMQALATAFFGSAAMASCGVLFGTSLRYVNYRRYPTTRMMWRCAVVVASVGAILIAVLLSQYRALLEALASDTADAGTYSIFTVPPSIVELPVFVGSIIVFAAAVWKFRGGPSTPWAKFADHAALDRAFRNADYDVIALNGQFAHNTEQIVVDEVNFHKEANDNERERLKAAKAECAKAKLKIEDLKNSYLKTVRAAEPDFAAALAGLRSVRPDLGPEDFPPVELRGIEGFPDLTELDVAVARAEAGFARRTQQIAEIETSVGTLASKAREDFSRFLTNAARREEKRRNPVQLIKIQMKGERQ